jgi:antitoxin ParD1/3/4
MPMTRMPTDNANMNDEQQYYAKLAALRAAIDEGDASGGADGDVFARVREALKPPTERR